MSQLEISGKLCTRKMRNLNLGEILVSKLTRGGGEFNIQFSFGNERLNV